MLFILSLVSIVINFADTALRVDDINQDSIQEVVSESTNKYETDKLPTPKLTEDDYNYFPLEGLTEREMKREFESFLKDPRNAGLNYNLVKRYDSTVRTKFLESVLLGDKFKKVLIDFGINLQIADKWFAKLIKEDRTFSLWEIHNNFIDFTNEPAELLQLATALQIELESNQTSFNLNDQADFDHLGSEKNMHLGIELQNRIDHLQMFASRSEKYEEISPHYYNLIFAVSIWMSRGILIVQENKNQLVEKKYELTEVERRKLSILFEGVNLEKSFTIDGKQVKSSLATGLIHVNEVFQLNRLEKVQNNVELIFRPYLQKRSTQIRQNAGNNHVLLKEFDQRYSYLESYKINLQKVESSISDLLSSYDIQVDIKGLHSRGQLARFLGTLAKRKINSKDFDDLLKLFEKFIQTRLLMMSEIIRLNTVFAKIYEKIEDSQVVLESRKKYLEGWINNYNRIAKTSNRKTYQEELQILFRLWKDHFPDLVVRFNVAFQNTTSECIDLFDNLKLKDIRVSKSDNLNVFRSSSTETSPEYKRVSCLLNYELHLREQYSTDTISNIFDDGFQSINYNLEDLALEYSLNSSMGSTSPENRSIYGLVYDLMKNRTEIVDLGYEGLQPFKSDVEEILKNTLLPLERQPANSRGEYSVTLPKGILHSLSGELNDGGNSVDIVWEKPVPSPIFFGSTLGICLGDSWLKTRDNLRKGQGSLELINELSHYMPKKVAMTILARRALLYKYSKLRRSLLRKQLIGDKPNRKQLTEKDTLELRYVEKMAEKSFIKSKPIHPVEITHGSGSTWVGFGYGFIGDPTAVRPLISQAEVSSVFHWEAVPPPGRDKEIFINPILDFNYRSNEQERTRYGPIFNLYFPIYKLELIKGSKDRFKISHIGFSAEDLESMFKHKINESSQKFSYLAGGKNYFVRFSDSILRSGLLLMDAFDNHEQHPPGISWKQKDISSQ